jgi:hypothetical protein
VSICGDLRQGIYAKDGLGVAEGLGLKRHLLKTHYRIGQRIARVADRLIPPKVGEPTLEETCNYNPRIQGDSSADMHQCQSREEQFKRMLELLTIQLDAFQGERIGVFCGKKETVSELRERFNATGMRATVCVHGVDPSPSFDGGHRIHVLTIHSAKGTEFRAVHLFGTEELRVFPLDKLQLGFTAITRAKTALNAFRTGETNMALENAFCQPSHVKLTDLFPLTS